MLIPCEKPSLNPELYLEKMEQKLYLDEMTLKELSQSSMFILIFYNDLVKEKFDWAFTYNSRKNPRKLRYTDTKISVSFSVSDISKTAHGMQRT